MFSPQEAVEDLFHSGEASKRSIRKKLGLADGEEGLRKPGYLRASVTGKIGSQTVRIAKIGIDRVQHRRSVNFALEV